MSKRVYILDPGHGDIDPNTGRYVTAGNRSPVWSDGSVYYEGQGNRAIAKIVGRELSKLGIKYGFTVPIDSFHDLGRTTRANNANKLVTESGIPGVLISIHSNGFSDPAAHGYEVFTSPGQTSADPLAEIMFCSIGEEFPELRPRPDYTDDDSDKEAKFTVLMKTKCPAILIESMFHTNEAECRILMSCKGKKRIAKAIVKAIQKMEEL